MYEALNLTACHLELALGGCSKQVTALHSDHYTHIQLYQYMLIRKCLKVHPSVIYEIETNHFQSHWLRVEPIFSLH